MRKTPKERKQQLLDEAVKIAAKSGFSNLTREKVADKCGVARSLISKYFGTMTNFKRDIMRAAIRGQVLPIIAEGLAINNRHAKKAPDELKKKASRYLSQV